MTQNNFFLPDEELLTQEAGSIAVYIKRKKVCSPYIKILKEFVVCLKFCQKCKMVKDNQKLDKYCNSWSHSSGVPTEQNFGDERYKEDNVVRHPI